MKICLVCSHDGHLTEMLQLLEAFEGHETFFITYESPRTRSLNNKYLFDNFSENLLKLFLSLPKIFKILIKEKPNIIVSTGAEIAIPIFYISKLLGIKTIFIESWCRVYTPSITGKMVYPVANKFLIQWKQLSKKYGKKARYEGAIF